MFTRRAVCRVVARACSPAAPPAPATTTCDAPRRAAAPRSARSASTSPRDDHEREAGRRLLPVRQRHLDRNTNTIPADRTALGHERHAAREGRARRARDHRRSRARRRRAGLEPRRRSPTITTPILNQDAIDARGLAPIQPALDADRRAAHARGSRCASIAHAGRRRDLRRSPWASALDERNPDRYITRHDARRPRPAGARILSPHRRRIPRTCAPQYEAHIARMLDARRPKRRRREGARASWRSKRRSPNGIGRSPIAASASAPTI